MRKCLMKLWKKSVLLILSFILLFTIGACVYGIKMYNDANKTAKDIYHSVGRVSKKRDKAVNIDAKEPFSILLMGIDTGDLGRVDQGRSDTTMVVTINPKEKKSVITSLERDILTPITGKKMDDKLNHAYAYGGAKMSINTVENLLDIPLDYYVSMNMKGLKDLIDAVGGIKVNNPFEFSLDGVVVPKGHITLNGETGLAYARMRKEDPEGDIGRQRRQREVVEKIVQKVMSFDGVKKYKKILNAVKANVITNLTWDDMIDIQSKYMGAFHNIKQMQLQGKVQHIDGVEYQLLNPNKLYNVQTKLRKQLGLAENKKRKMKNKKFYNSYSAYNEETNYENNYNDSVNQNTYQPVENY